MTYSGANHVGFTREEGTAYPHTFISLGSYKGLPFVTSGGPYYRGQYNRATEIYNDRFSENGRFSTNWITLADYPFAND